MAEFKPFENDTQSWSAGKGDGLTIENGLDRVAIYGEAKLAPGESGRAIAAELLEILSGISAQLGDAAPGASLAAKASKGSLTLSGDMDLEKGASSKQSVEGAIAALEAFMAEPSAKPSAAAAPAGPAKTAGKS